MLEIIAARKMVKQTKNVLWVDRKVNTINWRLKFGDDSIFE